MITGRILLLAAAAAVVWLGCAAFIGVDPRSETPAANTDVVVILGGRLDRMEPGLGLAHELQAPLALSSSAVYYAGRMGIDCGPDVVCFAPVPETTAGEASTLRLMAARRDWNHLTVVTSDFHAVRARLLFRQCFDADGVSVVSVPAQQSALQWATSRLREPVAILGALTLVRAC